MAHADGFGGDLDAGEIIQIPPGVMRSSNAATTFEPYKPTAMARACCGGLNEACVGNDRNRRRRSPDLNDGLPNTQSRSLRVGQRLLARRYATFLRSGDDPAMTVRLGSSFEPMLSI